MRFRSGYGESALGNMTTEVEAAAKEEERRRKKSAYSKAYYEANKATVSLKQKLRRQARLATTQVSKHETWRKPSRACQPTGHQRPRAIKTEWRAATNRSTTDAAHQTLSWSDALRDLPLTETLPADLFVKEIDESKAPPVDELVPTRCASISNETTRDWLCVCPYCMQ
ncbi:hypothetical protein SDRG_09828 [Saprolegnia diclina VS20]|uniref:Uncharacterized protein n=1 Tax=Saprolegnia diclina (strain VS20) TaxID=1156394 RepID=T0RR28_SAPDV|nr:hypothetical protein SDRG_09828 [Saprolegnia diclina VS20]EQC32502.1 hypothetical protein SDRG_09828 [Saprolegnia diclina VS20]|eukprot:XP_008614003.1 hypothetical protein SDRG_09828 [Saprolegnia diclina VS20]